MRRQLRLDLERGSAARPGVELQVLGRRLHRRAASEKLAHRVISSDGPRPFQETRTRECYQSATALLQDLERTARFQVKDSLRSPDDGLALALQHQVGPIELIR